MTGKVVLEAWIDGACEPNPGGIAAYGIVIRAGNGSKIYRMGIVGQGQGMTNNVAEYSALTTLLEMYKCSRHSVRRITIYSDSEMLINQMNGVKKAREGSYVPYYNWAVLLTNKIGRERLSFVHIPRGENAEADAFSKAAIRRYNEDKG